MKAINRNALKRDVAAIVDIQPELTAQQLNEELRTLLDQQSAGWPVLSVVRECQPGATLCQASAPPGRAEVAQDWPHR